MNIPWKYQYLPLYYLKRLYKYILFEFDSDGINDIFNENNDELYYLYNIENILIKEFYSYWIFNKFSIYMALEIPLNSYILSQKFDPLIFYFLKIIIWNYKKYFIFIKANIIIEREIKLI